MSSSHTPLTMSPPAPLAHFGNQGLCLLSLASSLQPCLFIWKYWQENTRSRLHLIVFQVSESTWVHFPFCIYHNFEWGAYDKVWRGRKKNGRRRENNAPAILCPQAPFYRRCTLYIHFHRLSHVLAVISLWELTSSEKWGHWEPEKQLAPHHSRREKASCSGIPETWTRLLSYLQVNLRSLSSVSSSLKWTNKILISCWTEKWDCVADVSYRI